MQATMQSPLGIILLTEENGALTRLDFTEDHREMPAGTPLLQEAIRQLAAYFAGERQAFSLPLMPRGTPFQIRCWEALQKIPYGRSVSYGEEAALLGQPRACRAVGSANGKNPLPILIPCHRVLASGGKLGGYSSGTEIKKKLLTLEGIPFCE